LDLKPGMKVLDIGCGWGSFAEYAAENYDVEVVGITISEEQEKLAAERCRDLPVEIRYQDYREVEEEFDRIVSIGMFEHVGYKNYEDYMQSVERCLARDGLSLLHTIGNHNESITTDPWIDKYIFPNGMIPAASQVVESVEDYFIIEDWHNFGPDYDKTLMSWYKNFQSAWDELSDNYSEKFYRMWTYYLQMTAGSFRGRKNNVWQVVLSPTGTDREYRSVR
ncbi:MAG: class I SAM-dependent methyltransferase, partial [bacterium]